MVELTVIYMANKMVVTMVVKAVVKTVAKKGKHLVVAKDVLLGKRLAV